MQYTIRVGWTSQRPVIPDEFFSYVTVEAESYVAASLLAAQITASHAEMVTSTKPWKPAIVTLWPIIPILKRLGELYGPS